MPAYMLAKPCNKRFQYQITSLQLAIFARQNILSKHSQPASRPADEHCVASLHNTDLFL